MTSLIKCEDENMQEQIDRIHQENYGYIDNNNGNGNIDQTIYNNIVEITFPIFHPNFPLETIVHIVHQLNENIDSIYDISLSSMGILRFYLVEGYYNQQDITNIVNNNINNLHISFQNIPIAIGRIHLNN